MTSTPKHNNTLHFIVCDLKKTTVKELRQGVSETLNVAIEKIKLMNGDVVIKDDQKTLA